MGIANLIGDTLQSHPAYQNIDLLLSGSVSVTFSGRVSLTEGTEVTTQGVLVPGTDLLEGGDVLQHKTETIQIFIQSPEITSGREGTTKTADFVIYNNNYFKIYETIDWRTSFGFIEAKAEGINIQGDTPLQLIQGDIVFGD